MPLRFSLRFLIDLGSVLVPFWPPKCRPGGPKRAPKRSPKTTKKRSENRCKKRSHVRTVSRPTWGDLGPILVPSWGQEGQKSKKSGCGSNAVHFFKKSGCGSRTGHGQPPFSSHSHLFTLKVSQTLTTATFFVTAGPGTPGAQPPVPRNPPEPLIASSVWGKKMFNMV